MTLKILAGTYEFQGTVQFDAAVTVAGGLNPWLKILPPSALGNKRFQWASAEFANSTASRPNFVVEMGHNIQGGGSLVDPTDDGFRDAWEQHYEYVPGSFMMERHIAFIPHSTPTAEIRVFTASFETTTKFTTAAHICDTFTLYDRATGNGYWQWLPSGILSMVFSAQIQLSVNNYVAFKQRNAASSAFLSLPYITNADETAIAQDGAFTAVVGPLGNQGVLRVQGTSTGNKQPIFTLYTNGSYQSIISQDATRMFFGAPNGVLANYQDATVRASASLALSNTGAADLPSTGLLRFSSTANVDTGTKDTGIARNAAGVLEVNSGTAGAFRDLKVRELLAAAGSATQASLNLPHGAAPSSPVNGDIWTTNAGLFVRINGATVGPLT